MQLIYASLNFIEQIITVFIYSNNVYVLKLFYFKVFEWVIHASDIKFKTGTKGI